MNKSLRKNIDKIKMEANELGEKYEALQKRYLQMRQHVEPKPLTRKRKKWTSICSDHTKRQRLTQYGQVLFNGIKEHGSTV